MTDDHPSRRRAARLRNQAERAMARAEALHARAMAAEDTKSRCALVDAYCRAADEVRAAIEAEHDEAMRQQRRAHRAAAVQARFGPRPGDTLH